MFTWGTLFIGNNMAFPLNNVYWCVRALGLHKVASVAVDI